MKPLASAEQYICSPCAAPLLAAVGQTAPLLMWCHVGTCERCGQPEQAISKARKYGLHRQATPETWNHST